MNDDELQDPVVLGALRRIGKAPATADLCPGCSRRRLTGDEDLCDDCRAQQRNQGRLDWYHRQGDYRRLRLDHGPREAAARWIAHQLRRGPLEASEITGRATTAGIPRKTLRRAREQLQGDGRLVVERAGLARGASRWRLTATAERTPDAQVGRRSLSGRADNAHHEDGPDGV